MYAHENAHMHTMQTYVHICEYVYSTQTHMLGMNTFAFLCSYI